MSRSADVKQRHQDTWARMVRHPFVLALGDGTLPRETFAAYMVQDYLFVDSLTRAVAYGIAKAPDAGEAKHLGAFLQTLLGAEDDLFRRLFATLGVAWPAGAAPEPGPVTRRFGGFLVRLGRRGSFAEIATALFVTEGTYAEWARRLVDEGRLPGDALYREWIDIHADASLAEFAAFLGRCMEAPATRVEEQRMERVFARVLREELAFWNAFHPNRRPRGKEAR